ncbi:glycosyltransferase family protein [Priestia endophytica]|uniref:glycosyltransferase family protein n=1 Tax=Priestia endophytica TaxID=135735 RepID=UPI001CEF8676|nr:glycosyltransferase family protein [Priestia endophytica]
MDNRKVDFISCVNNFEEYNTALQHIGSLKIPKEYKVETIAIEHADSITSGYNQGMKKSDAKYKVYLHQDVYILNKNFIYDVIALFEKHPNLGMIGVVGGKTLPNGFWGNSLEIYGTVYHTLKGKGNLGLLSFNEVSNDYEKVLAIDGLIMVTQYDLEWRDDLFKGWHFYDVSQSLEFANAGYEVGVPRQISPWCFHDCGITNLNGYEENREILIQNYRDYTIDLKITKSELIRFFKK